MYIFIYSAVNYTKDYAFLPLAALFCRWRHFFAAGVYSAIS